MLGRKPERRPEQRNPNANPNNVRMAGLKAAPLLALANPNANPNETQTQRSFGSGAFRPRSEHTRGCVVDEDEP
jgi:hypothetical protein